MKIIKSDTTGFIAEERSVWPYGGFVFILLSFVGVVLLATGQFALQEGAIFSGIMLIVGVVLLFQPLATTITVDPQLQAIQINKKRIFKSGQEQINIQDIDSFFVEIRVSTQRPTQTERSSNTQNSRSLSVDEILHAVLKSGARTQIYKRSSNKSFVSNMQGSAVQDFAKQLSAYTNIPLKG